MEYPQQIRAWIQQREKNNADRVADTGSSLFLVAQSKLKITAASRIFSQLPTKD
jgi:uncharacterized protein YecT (DUF1311 family)